MKHLPALLLDASLVFVALFTHMAEKDASAEQQTTTFTHQACPDCVVMRANYIPPKP